jgi:hypothetical protein
MPGTGRRTHSPADWNGPFPSDAGTCSAESTRFTSQLRLMKLMFGNLQHILVGEGAPRFSWCYTMEADKRDEAAASKRQIKEECRKLAEKARQEAVKHTHKLPRKLCEDKKEVKKISHLARLRPQEGGVCGPSCKERSNLWKEELSSLTTLVGAVAILLTVIALSEGAEFPGEQDDCLDRGRNVDTTGSVLLNYWMMLPLLLIITRMLVVRIRRYLNERQGKRTPSKRELEKWSSLQLGRLRTSQLSQEQLTGERRSRRATPAVQRGSVPRMLLLGLKS